MSVERATPRVFNAVAALVVPSRKRRAPSTLDQQRFSKLPSSPRLRQLRWLACHTTLLVGLFSNALVAQAATPEDRAAAKQHLTQAQEAKKAGQLAEACGHLEEVERLDPKLPTLLELADCTEQLGKLVEARAHWAAARDRAKQLEKPQSRARAEERLAAVEKRVAHLTLQLAANTPAEAQVLRDDVALEPATLASAQALNPGDHVVVVKLAGHDDAKYDVKLAEGDNQTLTIAPGPATAPPPAPPPPPPQVVAPPPKLAVDSSSLAGSGQRTVGLITGGVGLVSIGIGAPLWFVGYRDGNSLGPTADQQLLAGQILVIGGGALLATGAVLFFTAPSGSSSDRASVPVVPTLAIGSSTAVVGAAGAF